MPTADADTDDAYDDERFATRELFRSDRLKVVRGYFEPGQFIPVHAPSSDLLAVVERGTGTVREGGTDHAVEPGDTVVVEADTRRGVRADGGERLELLLATAPPPTDVEHDPVRRGLARGEFEPETGGESP